MNAEAEKRIQPSSVRVRMTVAVVLSPDWRTVGLVTANLNSRPRPGDDPPVAQLPMPDIKSWGKSETAIHPLLCPWPFPEGSAARRRSSHPEGGRLPLCQRTDIDRLLPRPTVEVNPIEVLESVGSEMWDPSSDEVTVNGPGLPLTETEQISATVMVTV